MSFFLNLKQNFGGAFCAAKEESARLWENPASRKALLLGGTCLGGLGAAYGYRHGFEQLAPQALAALGYAGIFLSYGFDKNHHKIAFGTLSAALIGIHAAMLGADDWAALSGMATLRGIVFSGMPHKEEDAPLRHKVGYAFAAATAPLLMYSGGLASVWSYVNLGGLGASVAADAMTSDPDPAKDNSHISRALRLAKHGLIATQAAFHAHSVSGTLCETVLGYWITKAICRFDLKNAAVAAGSQGNISWQTFKNYAALLVNKKAFLASRAALEPPGNVEPS